MNGPDQSSTYQRCPNAAALNNSKPNVLFSAHSAFQRLHPPVVEIGLEARDFYRDAIKNF